MADIKIIENIEQLRQFLNDKNVLEIAMRGKNQKFNAFQKIALNDLPNNEVKEQIQKAVNILNKNNNLLQKSTNILNGIAKLNKLNLILTGLNLCATCVGFTIMYAKLNNMSGQINQVLAAVKQGHEIQANYEFDKIISAHSDMLDHRKTKSYYTEEQMRKLVDGEYNVLKMLIDVFLKNASQDIESLIFSIYSLASMLAVSLRYFDEIYYFNNKEAIGDGDIWHSSHSNWMSVYNSLLSKEFIERIQDYGIFDLNLNTVENDAYYISLCDQVKDLRQEIEDNQELIIALDDKNIFETYRELSNQEIKNGIEQAFLEADVALDNEEIHKIYDDSIKKIAIA